MSNVDHAQQYAARGWHVFPLHWITSRGKCSCGKRCNSPGKHPYYPLAPNGHLDATIDPTVIERMWGQAPEANIGIATGPSGLTVLDVDGPEGRAQLDGLGHPEIKTLHARTGREGGWHLYYTGKTCPSSQVKGEHLDVRGTTGYVVAPPSNHASGRCYAWGKPLMLPAPCPEWIEPWVRSRTGTARETKPATIVQNLPEWIRSCSLPRLADRAAIGMTEPWSEHEEARLRAALAVIPADVDGKTWFSHGAAIHDLNWPNGIDIWDDWSKTSKGQGAGKGEYKGRADIEKRWAKFGKEYKGQRVTVASIYAHAAKLGWNGEIPDKTEASVDPIKNSVNGHEMPPELKALWGHPEQGIFPDLDKGKNPKQTCRNAAAAIRALGVTCEYDTFHNKMLLGGQPINQYAGELSDEATQMLRVMIGAEYDFDPGLTNTHDAAVQECLQNAFDPVQEYLDGLQWDGQKRLGGWLHRYLGADDSKFNSVVGVLVLAAAVRRVRVPGAKFDQIVVLESPEGRGKSTAIEILAGAENFSDQSILTLDDKGQQEAIQGIWLYEIADLAGMSKADVEKVKAFASRKVDRARPAYGRARVDRPRRCVFFATTNNETYLKSQTGNRRFWPVRVSRIDTEGLARDRDQIWAEAVRAEKVARELVMPVGMWGHATAIQDQRVDEDPWLSLLADLKGKEVEGVRGTEFRVSTRDLFETSLKLGADKITDGAAKRLAFVMRRLGWRGPELFKDGEITRRGYVRQLLTLPDDANSLAPPMR